MMITLKRKETGQLYAKRVNIYIQVYIIKTIKLHGKRVNIHMKIYIINKCKIAW